MRDSPDRPRLENRKLFASQAQASGLDGVLYGSLRYRSGQAAAIFWPDCLTLPIMQTQQFRYRWDGDRMTHYLPHDATAWTPWPIARSA